MSAYLDYSTASSSQIEADLCERLERIRLSRNTTQTQLAHEAGVSVRTIGRLEKGEGVSLDTFIRVLMALGIQRSLASVLPDPTVRPIERVGTTGAERRRARPGKPPESPETWTWGNERKSHGE
jgi:transcriptional regulator with XRE-family HTH domain